MPEQILLPGFEPEPQLTDRLFFAVMPDTGAVARVGQLSSRLKAQHQMRGKLIDPAKLHVSLCDLGDHPGIPPSLMARATQAAAATAAALAPFSVSFDTALSFANRARHRPCVLGGGDGMSGLQALYQALSTSLRIAGLPGGPANFTPHLTMLYDDATVPEQGVDPIDWTVRELVIVHSRIGQNLPYALLGRWLLQGAAA